MLAERNTAVKAVKTFLQVFLIQCFSNRAGYYSMNTIKNSIASHSARTDGVSKVSWPVWTKHPHISFKARANLKKVRKRNKIYVNLKNCMQIYETLANLKRLVLTLKMQKLQT